MVYTEVTVYYQALVIILSITLAVFLILAIYAVVKVIAILKDVKRITAKAEKVVDKAGEVTEFFQKSTGALSVGGLISSISQHFNKSKKGKSDHEER